MSTPRLNLYHSSKRKDARRNKSVHDDSTWNFVEGEGLFKFETKDDTPQLKPVAQQNNDFIPQSKLEVIFGHNLDKDNLGYLNSLIKTRELMDEMNFRKMKKQMRKGQAEVIQHEVPVLSNNQEDELMQASFTSQVRSPTLASDDVLGVEKEQTNQMSVDEGFLLINRDSIQEIKNEYLKSTEERIFSELSRHSSKEALEKARISALAFKRNAAQPKVKDSYAGGNDTKQEEEGPLGFVSSISQYLNYFDTVQREMGASNYLNYYSKEKDHFSDLQKEFEVIKNENRTLRRQNEKLEVKINELSKKNVLLAQQLSHNAQDEDLINKKSEREERIVDLTRQNKTLKKKLAYTQELLAKAKIENENSQLALKKVLQDKSLTAMKSKKDSGRGRVEDGYLSFIRNQEYSSPSKYGETTSKRHNKQPKETFENYLNQRFNQSVLEDKHVLNPLKYKVERDYSQQLLNETKRQADYKEKEEETDDIVFSDNEIGEANQNYSDSNDNDEANLSKEQQIKEIKKKLHALLETSDTAADMILPLGNSKYDLNKKASKLKSKGEELKVKKSDHKRAGTDKISHRYMSGLDIEADSQISHRFNNKSFSPNNSD